MAEQVFPGINSQVSLWRFDPDERKIIQKLSSELYITNSGEELHLGPTSTYHYFLIKPTDFYREMFNLEREIVVIFSRYLRFEPRTLDAIDAAFKRNQKLRLEKICSIVISKDSAIESKVIDLLRSQPEERVLVPFSYDELLGKTDSYFIRNRFKKHFYTRDLFAFEGPLKKDLYFL